MDGGRRDPQARAAATVCSHCPWRGMVPPPQVECSEIILIRQSMSWSAITLLFPVQHFHDMKFIQYWSSVFTLPVLITIVKRHTSICIDHKQMMLCSHSFINCLKLDMFSCYKNTLPLDSCSNSEHQRHETLVCRHTTCRSQC